VRSSGTTPETVSGVGPVVDGVTDPSGEFATLLARDGQVWSLEAVGDPKRLARAAGASVVASAGDRLFVGLLDRVQRLELGGGVLWSSPVPPLTDLAVSGDGAWVACGGLDGSTTILEAETGAVRARLPPHGDRVSSLVFAGDHLYTSSWDRTVRVWGLGPLRLEAGALPPGLEASWGSDLEIALQTSATIGAGAR
jgi:WD40 repeat protein